MVKYRIQRKILYLNSLLIIIVTLISLGLAYFYFERLQEAKFDTMTTFFADSQQSNISQLLSNANNIALHVSFSPQIIETFSKPELEQNDTINYFANTVNEKKIYLMNYSPLSLTTKPLIEYASTIIREILSFQEKPSMKIWQLGF